MTTDDDLLLNGLSNTCSFSTPFECQKSAIDPSSCSNDETLSRKDMAASQPVPIKIDDSKLLNAHGPRYREDTFERFCPSNRMPRIYAHFGYFVGLHPFKFFVLGLLISSLSVGMLSVRLEDNARDGYTPSTSRARKESDMLRSFMNSTIDPVSTIVMFRAKDGGSMHRLSYIRETLRIAKFLSENFTISYQFSADGPAMACKYIDFCGSFCNSHYFLRSFMWAMEEQIDRYKKGKPLDTRTNLTFPIGKCNNFEYHLEGNLFGVKTRNVNDTKPAPSDILPTTNCSSCQDNELAVAQAVTYIDYVELIMLVFRGDFVNEGDEVRAQAWEMAAYDHLRNNFNHDLIEVLMLGNGIVDFELKQDGKRMTPYFIIGFMFTIAFVVVTVITDSVVEKVMDVGKFIVALVLIICPSLSITTTFGIFGLLGQRINSVSMIMPFLIMGIGVNDSFLMLHAWHRTSIDRVSIPQRMGLILEDVGPSITITTVTDVTTFILGSLTPTAEISLFCRTTAVALALCYLFTLLLFLPIVCYCSKLENPNSAAMSRNPSSRGAKLERLYDKVSLAYCRWIMHPATGIVTILLVVSFLAFTIVGFIRIEARLDTEKILPYESPIRKPHELIAHKVWVDYYPVTIFVNQPLDLDQNNTMGRLNQMVSDFESMEKCKGKQFTHLWIRDYERFRLDDFSFVDFFSLGGDSKQLPTTTSKPEVVLRPYYKKMKNFLASAYYTHYNAFLKLDYSYEIPVRRFWFTVIYHNTSNWDERIDLMLNLREVADRYEDLDVSVWEVNGMFVDQMLSLKWLTYYNGIVTIACMTVMCIFFISQWFLIGLAVLSIASITIEVVGCLSWWGLDLDPVTLCAILMSIGMSVDFTAHIAYHLKLNDILRVRDRQLYRYKLVTNQHKVIGTLEAVGWPTVQAGTSTIVCVLPLIFLQNYIPLVFVKTISLVVICGMIHGLIIMPAVFALSWRCLDYLRKVFALSHHDTLNRHVHTVDVLPPRRGDSLNQCERQAQSLSYSDLLLSSAQTERQDLLAEKSDVSRNGECNTGGGSLASDNAILHELADDRSLVSDK